MWLLSVACAELHFFPSPDAVTGGYAILSHTWGEDEQTYQQIRAIIDRCTVSGENPRDLVCPKIRNTCLAAAEHGYRWVWIDTCCIDKTSSTELSEAINSMYRWYSCAEVCYALLEDVPSDCDLSAPGSAFRRARWHTRGWTLQELIASAVVIFMSRDWEPLGDKIALAPLLAQITGVRRDVLTRAVSISSVSVAQRFSWAAGRNTTRVEDEAYCLMGIFDVYMPTIYGEGRRAFARLQQEIMKQTFDTSLFAWGQTLPSGILNISPPEKTYTTYSMASGMTQVYLLARSPVAFRVGSRLTSFTPGAGRHLQPYLPGQWPQNDATPENSHKKKFGPFGHLELPKFVVTSRGVECRFPVFDVDGYVIAVLLCENAENHFGLALHPSGVTLQDPSRPTYHVGLGARKADGGPAFGRLALLGNDLYNLRFNGRTFQAEWRDVLIVDGPAVSRDELPSVCAPLNCIASVPPFRVPYWLVGRLAALGLNAQPVRFISRPINGRPLVAQLVFEHISAREGLRVMLGTCTGQRGEQEQETRHWATVSLLSPAEWRLGGSTGHDCAVDHVEEWPGWEKEFGDGERVARLSFSRCKITPDATLVLHLELTGSAYEGIQRRLGVWLPSHEELVQEEEGLDDPYDLSPSESGSFD